MSEQSGQYNGRRKGQFASRSVLKAQQEALLAPVSKFSKHWVYPTGVSAGGISGNQYKVLKWIKLDRALTIEDAEEQEEEIRLNTQAAGDQSMEEAVVGTPSAVVTGQATPIDVSTPPASAQATGVNAPLIPPSVSYPHPLSMEVIIPPESNPSKPALKELEEIRHEEGRDLPLEDGQDAEMKPVATTAGEVLVQQSNEEAVAVALDEKTLN